MIASGGTWDLGPGAVAAIGTICALLSALFVKQGRDARALHSAAAATADVAATAADVVGEVKRTLTENNGGSSVKDALDDLRVGQRLVLERLGEHSARLQSLESRLPRRRSDQLPPPPLPMPKEG